MFTRYRPSAEDIQSAQSLSSVLRRSTGQAFLRVDNQAGGETTVALPPMAIKVLTGAMSQVAKGAAIAMVSRAADLTTNQAADQLGMSLPLLKRLMDLGKIPFHFVGSHRRLKLCDVQAYRRNQGSGPKDPP
jgi:excisionase family DNA binding protein